MAVGVCFRDIICFLCNCIFHSEPAGFGGKSRNTRGTTDGSRSFTEDNSDYLSWYVHDAKHNSEAHLPFHIRRRQGGFLQGYDTSFTVIRGRFPAVDFHNKTPMHQQINTSTKPTINALLEINPVQHNTQGDFCWLESREDDSDLTLKPCSLIWFQQSTLPIYDRHV